MKIYNIYIIRVSGLIITTAAVLMLSFSICTAQTPKWLWGQMGHGTDKTDNYATVATDKQGNAYITGLFADNIFFGTYNLSTQIEDVYLVKYNSAGIVEWATNPSSNVLGSMSYGLGIATDSFGNIFVTGNFEGQFAFGNDTLSNFNNGGHSVFLAKYDSNGNLLWAKQSNKIVDGQKEPSSNSVACDYYGNAYITGNFRDSIQFGTYILDSASLYGNNTVFLTKYDPNGNVLWAKQSKGSGEALSRCVITYKGGESTADSARTDSVSTKDGFEYITGYANSDTVYFGTCSIIPSMDYHLNSPSNAFIVKYDTVGNVLWAKQSISPLNAGSEYDEGLAVTTDNLGNGYVGGVFGDSIRFDSQVLTSPDSSAFLVKYNSSGNVLWAKASIKGSWVGTSLASDNINHIYYGGLGVMDTLQWGSNIFSTTESSYFQSYATFIMMMDTAGNALCGSAHANGATEEGEDLTYFTGIASDSSGKYIYQAGSFFDDSLFCGSDTLIDGGGGNAIYVTRWNACNLIEGINEVKEKGEELTVFPNPFHNSATIVLNTQNPLSDANYIEIDDITGRQLKWIEFKAEEYELSAAGIASGLYFVRVFDREKNVIGATKIVVQ